MPNVLRILKLKLELKTIIGALDSVSRKELNFLAHNTAPKLLHMHRKKKGLYTKGQGRSGGGRFCIKDVVMLPRVSVNDKTGCAEHKESG